jgi:predicted metal-dependent hydrolase
MATGDTLLFLGENYNVELFEGKDILLESKTIFVPSVVNSKEVLINWLKKQALTVFTERVERYSSIMGVTALSIKITEAKSRWGSCSVKNNLNFAWRLVLCPLPVIDYVVVHELSHIEYKNHSKKFWIKVRTVLPKYQEEQNWLKANKRVMEII